MFTPSLRVLFPRGCVSSTHCIRRLTRLSLSSLRPPTRCLHTSQLDRRTTRKGIILASGLGVGLLLGQAQCRATTSGPSSHPPEQPSLPPLTLYQYHTCPYCSKTRAFLDYHGLPYKVVEVNPVSRKETRGFKYRKLPFLVADGVQVGDSSLIISILRTCMVATDTSIPAALELYPEISFTDGKGKETVERTNKYFIMFGYEGEEIGTSIAQRREEREWREWVDTKLTRCFPPNIYRTVPEALRTCDNITRLGNFSSLQRLPSKYLGALAMYVLGKMLTKKYNLGPDVRQSLYERCNEWTTAIGTSRLFMGGSRPNLADLAVYGALSSIEGLDTFTDVMENTSVGQWYWAMKDEVTQSMGR